MFTFFGVPEVIFKEKPPTLVRMKPLAYLSTYILGLVIIAT